MNRQRLTAEALWDELVDYVSRIELWEGCEDCPGSEGERPGTAPAVGCPMRSNAAALRRQDVRSALRLLLQTVSGETVTTIREVLALLAWCVVGTANQETDTPVPQSCRAVRDAARDRGASAFTATTAYYNLVFGEGTSLEPASDRQSCPAIHRLGVGLVADLEVDEWLRDTGSAPTDVQRLSGRSRAHGGGLPLSRRQHWAFRSVGTSAGEMTYHKLGELISISEDPEIVRAATRALVLAEPPVQRMWRRTA